MRGHGRESAMSLPLGHLSDTVFVSPTLSSHFLHFLIHADIIMFVFCNPHTVIIYVLYESFCFCSWSDVLLFALL